jgi:hypothetical protein
MQIAASCMAIRIKPRDASTRQLLSNKDFKC